MDSIVIQSPASARFTRSDFQLLVMSKRIASFLGSLPETGLLYRGRRATETQKGDREAQWARISSVS